MEQISAFTGTPAFLEPERIVQYFDLAKGDHVADFGAGHGYFTIPMAGVVGGDGKVYALDIQKSVLDIIRAKAKVEHLFNIEPIWADLERPGGSHLKDEFLDFVLIANIFFQVENRSPLLTEAFRILRKGGRLAAIEWDSPSQLFAGAGGRPEPTDVIIKKSGEGKTPLGPPLELRIRKDLTKKLAEEAGFALDREFEAGSQHYGLLFKKP